MTSYFMHGLTLNNSQIKKIIRAATKHSPVTIRLSKNNFNGSHNLPLTKTQINRINKAKNGLHLKLSYAQIKHVKKFVSDLQKEYKGGIIPLLTLIPIIASALGAAGGVAGGISSAVSASNTAKAATAAQIESERHNKEIEAQLKGGSGYKNFLKPLSQKLGLSIGDYNKIIKGDCVCLGKGLFLKSHGSGLYIGPEL
jgi:hypothetical protein